MIINVANFACFWHFFVLFLNAIIAAAGAAVTDTNTITFGSEVCANIFRIHSLCGKVLHSLSPPHTYPRAVFICWY